MSKKTKLIFYVIAAIIIVIALIYAVYAITGSGYKTETSYAPVQGLPMDELAYNESSEMSFGLALRESADYENSVKSQTAPAPTAPQDDIDSQSSDRMIIKTGQLSIVVQDVNESIKTISDYAVEKGGFVVSSRTYKINSKPYGEIAIRIPAQEFDQGFAGFKEIGDVESERIQGQDVTEEYIDMESQLKNLEATEERILAILNRTGEISDVLEVERELKRIRSEIEVMQGRMKYLKQSADLSTITVSLSTDPSVLPTLDESEKWRPLGVLKNAARSMVNVLKIIANLIIKIIVFIPVWMTIGLIIYLIYRIYKRIKKKKTRES